MNNEKRTLTRPLNSSETVIYQTLASDAIFRRTDEYPTSYSILILLAENDTVMQSEILYDVSRSEDTCIDIMNELFKHNISPDNAKRSLATYA